VRQLNNVSSAGCLLENLPSWHVSYRGSAQQPWVLLSFEDQSACGTPAAPNSPEWFGTSGCYQSPSANWSLYEDEIMLVRIDANNDSSKVYRLARGYSRTDENFNAQLKAAISRDGKYIAFDSNMAFAQSGCPSNFQQNGDGTITNCADVYVVKVR